MKFKVETKGHYDFVDVTPQVTSLVRQLNIQNGAAIVFVSGSTAAITTMEYEEGIIQDLIRTFEMLAPEKGEYRHHLRWGDRNGAAHIKSALVGTDVMIPLEEGELLLGTWQQIVLIDFDERPRTREVVVKLIEEAVK